MRSRQLLAHCIISLVFTLILLLLFENIDSKQKFFDRVSSIFSEFNRPDIPEFPWPPPKSSALDRIPQSSMSELGNLGEIDKKIRTSLDLSGYHECSYFSVPNGFALVTRIEQINEERYSKANVDRSKINETRY